MVDNDIRRPDFVEGWLRDLQDTKEKYGVYRLMPWWVLSFAVIGGGASWCIPEEFWKHPDRSIPFLVGLLTVDGLFLAFSWNSFGKIYEAACAPQFGAYLRRNGLLTKYFFHVDYVHITQVTAVICAAAALTLSAIDIVPIWSKRLALAFTMASLLYALRYALGAVRIMQDIVWYRTVFDSGNGRSADVLRVPTGRSPTL